MVLLEQQKEGHMTRIVVAYDRSPRSYEEYFADAQMLTSLIRQHQVIVKIGMEAMTATRKADGSLFPSSIGEMMRAFVVEQRGSVLWDAKYKDIGNTVEHAVTNIAGSVHAVTVHADRDVNWLTRIVAARDKEAGANPTKKTVLFGVTLLTDTDERESDYLYSARPKVVVEKRLYALIGAGFDGVVCSAQELEVVQRVDPDHTMERLVPGTRLPGDPTHDQARVMTPKQAVENGADLLVFGRPIWEHPQGPKAGVETILEHLA